MKYRKIPVVIEAVRYIGDHENIFSEQPDWLLEAIESKKIKIMTGKLNVYTLEGLMTAKPGSYIIRGIKGELYPCDAEIFESSYENANNGVNTGVFHLPCNIGDTIYVNKYSTITGDFDIVTRTVKNIRYDAIDNTFMISDGEFYREFGKKVFLTREEAENCLNI